jgi:hypothetical protein
LVRQQRKSATHQSATLCHGAKTCSPCHCQPTFWTSCDYVSRGSQRAGAEARPPGKSGTKLSYGMLRSRVCSSVNRLLHVEGQGMPSFAVHAQEACRHVWSRESLGTFGRRVAEGVRMTWCTLSAVEPCVGLRQWASAVRSGTFISGALTCERQPNAAHFFHALL